jgi:hypothetical protein
VENNEYHLSAGGYSQNRKVRSTQLSSPYSDELKQIKTRLLHVSNNIAQIGYVDLRELRKRFYRLALQKEKFTKLDYEESTEIKRLLEKLKKTHPEICSKQQFIESSNSQRHSQPSSSQTIETTFDRPSSEPLFAYPNQSRNLLSSSITDRNYHSQPLRPAKLLPEASERKRKHKPSESFRESSLFPTQNMRESEQTPVADTIHVEMPAEEQEKEEETDIEEKIQQYERWAHELYEALEEQYPGR